MCNRHTKHHSIFPHFCQLHIYFSWYVFDSMAVGQLTTRMRESVKRLSIIKKPSVSFLSFRSSVKEENEGGADEENGSIP